MKKVASVLLGLAIFGPLYLGCSNAQSLSMVEIQSVKLEDWVDPKDGKTYLVAMPTWKNSSSQDIRQATFAASTRRGSETIPSLEPREPQFFGGVVEPGSVVHPVRIPEDGVVLGEKAELAGVRAEDVEIVALGSSEDYSPPSSPGA
jgi:hypothetical protein